VFSQAPWEPHHGNIAEPTDGTPAYLESSSSMRIPPYEGHEFELLGTIQAGALPRIGAMLRKPR
jgi:hypothetical protein